MWASRSVKLEAVRVLGTQKDQGGKRLCARPLSFWFDTEGWTEFLWISKQGEELRLKDGPLLPASACHVKKWEVDRAVTRTQGKLP